MSGFSVTVSFEQFSQSGYPGPWTTNFSGGSVAGTNFTFMSEDQVIGVLKAGHYGLHLQINAPGSDGDNTAFDSDFQVLAAPAIAVTPTNHDFGPIQIGNSITNTFMVSNAGAGTLSGAATVAPPFTVGAGETYNLGSNQSTNVSIIYTPTNAVSNTAMAHFTGGKGFNATVTGIGYPPPKIAINPVFFNFGSVAVGSVSNAVFTISNAGGGNLIGVASVLPPFNIISGVNYTLTQNQSSNILIRYGPTNVASNSLTVSLTGGGGTNALLTGNSYISPQTLSFSASGSNISLYWPLMPIGFTLQESASLGPTNWANVPNSPSNASGSNEITLPISNSNELFRLIYPVTNR